MQNNSNIVYRPNASLVQNINPLIKIVCFLLFTLACFFKYNYYLLVIMTSIVIIIIIFSNIHVKYYINIIFKMFFPMAIIGALLYRYQVEPVNIMVSALKILFWIICLSSYLSTTAPDKLGKSISVIINLFNFIGINPKIIELSIIKFLKKIYFIFNIKKELLEHQALKGKDYKHSNYLSKKFLILKNKKQISQFGKSKVIEFQEEMKYKMYDNNLKKYPYRKKIGIFDCIYLGLHLSLLIIYILVVR